MLEFHPTKEEFVQQASTDVAVPIYCSLLSDQLTPVAAFERVAMDSEHAFLLESVIGGENIARYSFLSLDPVAICQARDRRTIITTAADRKVIEDTDPLEQLSSLVAGFKTKHPAGLPRFIGGAVGYAGYEIARNYEKLGTPPTDDRDLPDLQFGIYDRMVIFDHVRKLVHLLVHAKSGGAGTQRDAEVAYDVACKRIEHIVRQLSDVSPSAPRPIVSTPTSGEDYNSNFSKQQFEAAVETCKEYIRAGEIFQVVISHRLTVETGAPPFDIYRALRVINPSPFMFFLKTPTVTLVGCSPEILCRIEGNYITSRPLAGTRPRGRSDAEDRGLETELLADPKERAEHVMLVDLGRNDLGRVCVPGSVKVDELMSVERYSHVMHICSNVSGTLAADKTAYDAVRSVLPVGTVSGAPKIRAMQIIDELETVRRGPYAGAVGYIDFDGNMDTCIALRTLVITPATNGRQRVDAQVGAGIVADSDPATEFQETLNKAQGLLRALDIANAWAGE